MWLTQNKTICLNFNDLLGKGIISSEKLMCSFEFSSKIIFPILIRFKRSRHKISIKQTQPFSGKFVQLSSK